MNIDGVKRKLADDRRRFIVGTPEEYPRSGSSITILEGEALVAEIEKYRKDYVPLIAALAIYGESASLPALVEKARALNERNAGG